MARRKNVPHPQHATALREAQQQVMEAAIDERNEHQRTRDNLPEGGCGCRLCYMVDRWLELRAKVSP